MHSYLAVMGDRDAAVQVLILVVMEDALVQTRRGKDVFR